MRYLTADTFASSSVLYCVYNIDNGCPFNFMDFMGKRESAFQVEENKYLCETQSSDVCKRYADTIDLFEAIGCKPKFCLKESGAALVKWYRDHYKV